MRILLIALGIFGIFSQSPTAGELAQHDHVLWGTVIKPTSEFRQDLMEARFRGILSTVGADANVVHVEVTDRPESYLLTGMGRDELNYEAWRNMYSEYENRIPPIAEVLAIGKNAAMRIRNERGVVKKTIIQGDNPYVIHACGENLSLLHLGVNEPLRAPDYKKSYVSLSFFFVAAARPNEGLARCALREAMRLSKTADVYVSIRTDPWFIEDSLFPVVSPFLSEVHPLSKEEYQSAIQWTCGISDDGKTVCWGRGPIK